jgi:biopolymer transport protein ExbD
MRREPEAAEVDMVPMIDIVTLLLMFLIIVGDMTKSTSAVRMMLPRASEAKMEPQIPVSTEGRLVVQLSQDAAGKYWAVVDNGRYELLPRGERSTLQDYFQTQINRRLLRDPDIVDKDGVVKFPVKLRVPAGAPMIEVERIVMAMANVGLVNIHYAAVNQ